MARGKHIRQETDISQFTYENASFPQEKEGKPSWEQKPNPSHGKFYKTVGLLAIFVALLTVLICVFLARTEESPSSSNTGTSSDLPISSLQGSPSSTPSELPPSSEEPPASSEPEPSSEPDPSSNVSVLPPQAVPFELNPIDKALELALGEASNNMQLIRAYEDALNAWKSEITKQTSRLSRLAENSAAFLQEQRDWEQWVEKTYDGDNTEDEGSHAPLLRAEEECNAYRDRAQVLYTKLVKYDPSYQIELS